MVDLIKGHRNEVADLCRRIGAQGLDAFGTVVRDDLDPGKSDLDLFGRVR